MANEYAVNQSDLTAVANAIRSKGGTSNALTFPNGFVNGINSISSGTKLPVLTNPGTADDLLYGKELIGQNGTKVTGTMVNNGDVSKAIDGLTTMSATIPAGYTTGGTVSLTDDIENEVTTQKSLIAQIATALEGKAAGGETANPILQSKTVTPATSSQTVTPDSGYDGLSQVTVNAMPTGPQATPSISVSTGGLITASATQTAGYVASGTKSATKQLTTQAAQTITPGTSNKTIASGTYLTGTQTVKGDANLLAANIKSGVSIFNVLGTFEGSGGGSSSGLPSGVSALASGIFTPTEDYTSGVQVEHSLGVTPNFVVWWLEDDVSASVLTSIAVVGGIAVKSAKYTETSSIVYNVAWFANGYNSSSQFGSANGRMSNQTYMTDTTCRLHTNSTYPIKTGYNYRWVCGLIDGVA